MNFRHAPLMKTTAPILVALLTSTLVIHGCAAEDTPPPETTDAVTDGTVDAPGTTLTAAMDAGVRNARMPLPGVVTAGQPTVEQLVALREAGAGHFISLRPTSEDGAGWEEAHAEEQGYDFERLPISGAASLTRENVEAFAAMLEEAGEAPTVVYCASSNRVGAMLALKAHWIDGVPAEDALMLGRESGLTRLEGPVRELLGL